LAAGADAGTGRATTGDFAPAGADD